MSPEVESIGASVLIVDDDEGMLETLADILAARDHEVATARSGEEALALLRDRHVDLVLMDIRMPGLDGLQALRRMRAQQPDLPVIMMTAFTRHDSVEEARGLGVTVLPKPLDLELVLDRLARVTRNPGPGTEP
jgi:CheY-like chemotaxis protein